MFDNKIVSVGFGKYEVSRDPQTVLTTFGLGSCVAVSFYDPVEKLGGVLHVALPVTHKEEEKASAKYANTGIPMLLEELLKQGAEKRRIIVKLCGGAQILKLNYSLNTLDIGDRNIKAVKETLRSLGMTVQAEETGGNRGRTYKLFVGTGKSLVKSANSQEEL